MNDIYSLLGLNEDALNNFHLQANTVADHQIERVVNANMRQLKAIEDRMLTDCSSKFTLKSVDEVLEKVKRCSLVSDHTTEEWSSYELRIISYYLMKLQGDDRSHDYGLYLLDKNWKYLFLNGLVFYVLNGWNLMRQDYRENVCHLIVKKLSAYSENNKKYLLLKNHANFFEENGPLRMATLIKTKDIRLIDAPSIIGYKSSSFSMSYFSDVIVNYLNGSHFDNAERFDEIFSKHNLDRTKKLVFANLVETADKAGDPFEQNQLSKYAHRNLGDISKSVTWTPFTGATNSDISKLRYAKDLVNMWYVRKVIEVFFEVCVQDAARKRFWLKYATEGYIKDFRIAGSTLVRQRMQNDERISTLFTRFFINTNSKTSQTAALILFIKNMVLVEFSDTGALYAYENTNEVIDFIRKGRSYIGSVSDLKLTYLSSLVDESSYYSTYYRTEGRMRHQGEWQNRLNRWMFRKCLTSDDTSSDDDPDDKVFIPQPLPAQSPSPGFKDDNEEVIIVCRPNKSNTSFQRESSQLGIQFSSNDFETNIRIGFASKWILDKFRIVGNAQGFYIQVKNKFYHVKNLDEDESSQGSVWIKSPKDGWYNTVHFDSGNVTIIGYFKIDGNRLLYKLEENQTSYKTIDL